MSLQLNPSGWGVVALWSSGADDIDGSRENTAIQELFGPVVLDKTSAYFMGATVGIVLLIRISLFF